jgi:hypothetical protein
VAVDVIAGAVELDEFEFGTIATGWPAFEFDAGVEAGAVFLLSVGEGLLHAIENNAARVSTAEALRTFI